MDICEIYCDMNENKLTQYEVQCRVFRGLRNEFYFSEHKPENPVPSTAIDAKRKQFSTPSWSTWQTKSYPYTFH
jgi:hypothetical protein